MGHALRVTEAGATPQHRSRDAQCVKGWVTHASSEFGRVLPGFLFMGYLYCFLQVRITSKVKRIKWARTCSDSSPSANYFLFV
jgi:hypothetical protein